MPSIDDLFDKANSILDLIDPPNRKEEEREVDSFQEELHSQDRRVRRGSGETAISRPVEWREFTSDDKWHVAVLFQKSLYQALCGEVSDIYDATLVEAPSKIQVCSRCLSTSWNRVRK